MQLKDITKSLDDMTDEELLEQLKGIRHNRDVRKAAVVARKERATVKEKRKTTKKVDKRMDDLFGQLSEEEKAELIKQLEG